jgi:predicted nucleotidyltransferase
LILLPDFNIAGDLPPRIYTVTLEESLQRFGNRHSQRQEVTRRLHHIYRFAQITKSVQHFLVFGSYVTQKPLPNDIDIVLVMQDDFRVVNCVEEAKRLFDHEQADYSFGASIFWVRPALLFLETLNEFIAHWQVKRDQTQRGILEIVL